MKPISPVHIISFLIAVLLTSCSPKLPVATKTTSIETPSIIVEMISSPKTSDIKVEFSGYRYEQSVKILILNICFDFPEEEKWILDDVVLKIDDEEISRGFMSLDTNEDGLNCQGIQFVLDSIPDASEAELSIGKALTYFIKDVSTCDKAQKDLDEAETGIVIRCDLNPSGAISGFEILKKPESMSDQEAREQVLSEFLSVIQVDWKFMFLIRKP